MRTLKDIPHLENVPVLVRAPLNVPLVNGEVQNAFRLKSALPTIDYLRKHHARVILISHIGDKGTETLEPVYRAMREHIPTLSFLPVSTGPEVRQAVRDLRPGEVLMLENLRRNAGEKKNDPEFVKELASLADIFVQDSFDACHREHASIVGVPELLPSYAGLLVEREVAELSKALKPKRPALAIISGAKFSTKEPVVKRLLTTYDHVYVGGALGNDFVRAKGFSVGASLVSEEGQKEIQGLLTNKKLVTALDAIVALPQATREQGRVASLDDVHADEAILDAGPHTAAALIDLVNRAKTVLWNGPLGLFEQGFLDSTRSLAKAVVNSKAHSIVGGGDTVSAIEQLGYADQFSFVSTGGGAMLDFIAKGTLPGIEVLT